MTSLSTIKASIVIPSVNAHQINIMADSNNYTIQKAYHHSTESWSHGIVELDGMTVTALQGSSMAVIKWPDPRGKHLHIFYQDPDLHLRELAENPHSGLWEFGEPMIEICLSKTAPTTS